jgi:RND family efflux transporter MFP subunit
MTRSHIALALVTALGLGACGQSSQAGPESRPGPGTVPERPPIRITTATVEARPVQRSVDTLGSLLAWDEVIAKSQAVGTVVRLGADLGDALEAGQVLAELDRREADLGLDQLTADLAAARDNLARARAAAEASDAALQRTRDHRRVLEADVERARADAEWRRREYERTRELFARELIATRDVDSARTQYEMAQAQVRMVESVLAQHGDQVRVAEAQREAELRAVKTAEAQIRQREAALDLGRKRLGDTTVPAPISGLVARRHVSLGEFVKDNTPLFTLVATDPLKYTGTVAERFAPDIRAGQEVRLAVDAFADRAFAGQVTRIAPVVDVATRTLALEARVPNGGGLLRPGFFARGVVLTRRDPHVAFVPAEALAYAVGLTKVFVVADGRVRERSVKAGPTQGGWTEIIEGVQPGEVVATSALGQLYDQAPVRVGK